MKKILITFIILAVFFLIISILVFINSPILEKIDSKIGKLLFVGNNTLFREVSIFFTSIADPIISTIIVVVLSVVSIMRKKKYDLYLIVISSGLAIFLSSAIKFLFDKARPVQSLISEGTASFPSNHSVISAVLLCFLFYIISDSIKNVYLKNIIKTLVFFVFVFIPLTRIMLGAHFTSDVLAGFGLGLAMYIFTGMLLSVLTGGKADCDVCLKEKNVL